jgi:hypothetical protein
MRCNDFFRRPLGKGARAPSSDVAPTCGTGPRRATGRPRSRMMISFSAWTRSRDRAILACMPRAETPVHEASDGRDREIIRRNP